MLKNSLKLEKFKREKKLETETIRNKILDEFLCFLFHSRIILATLEKFIDGGNYKILHRLFF